MGTWPGCEDVRPVHLQVAIRFAFSLSLYTACPAVLFLHVGVSFNFLHYKSFYGLWQRKIKCDFYLEVLVSRGELTNGIVDAGVQNQLRRHVLV